MKVLHLISNRDNSGGTIAALNLHNALLARGYDSSILSTDLISGTLQGKGYRRFGGFTGRVQRAFLGLENYLARPGFINPVDKWLLKKALKRFDGILHIHVTHVAQTSYDLLEWLAKDNKVFWTLHDLWPLTAKCIHPTYCDKWQTTCNNCPKLHEYPNLEWDNTLYLHKHKHSFISAHNIHFISPSKWIEKMFENKIAELGGRISTIPHGIDDHVFSQQNRAKIREELGLPKDGLFILFPQGRWDDPKKGISWYLEIKNTLAIQGDLNKEIYLLKIEGIKLEINELSPFLNEILLPQVNAKELMAKYYQAADLSVSLSEIETFGMCVAESLATSLPVIARSADGINELLDFLPEILVSEAKDIVLAILNERWKYVDYSSLYNKNFSLENWAAKHIAYYES